MLAPGGVRDAANPHPDSVRACVSSPFQLKPPAIAFFVSIDAALIIAGVGLVWLRKLGALGISTAALLLLVRTAPQSTGLFWSLILLPLLFTAVCW